MSQAREHALAIPLADGVQALEGILAAGADTEAGGVVIAPPHPLYGGSMDSPVVNELAFACRTAGLASLRFNWRGVGGSGGDASGAPADGEADYAAALAELAETLEGPLVGCGYSFGAAAALAVAPRHPRVQRLLLVSPPQALLDAQALADFPGSTLVVVGERDDFAPASELARLADRLPRVACRVVDEADHFFLAGLSAVGRAASDWLAGRRDPVG